jgi:hypothetical protein
MSDLTASIQRLIDHPNTPENERDAARRALARVQARTEQRQVDYRYAWEGGKYRETKDLSALQIAALIREDIKVVRKAARMAARSNADVAVFDPIASLPKEARVTVRRTWVTHTARIVIAIRGLDGEHWWRYARGYQAPQHGHPVEYNEPRYFARLPLYEVGDALADLANAYNFDNSDLMTDYHHVRFYLDIEAFPPSGYAPDIAGGRRFYTEQITEWIGEEPLPTAAA